VTHRPVYLDTSALAKLVFPEPESPALSAWLAAWPDRVASSLAAIELGRLLTRSRASAAQRKRASVVLSAVALLKLDDPVLETAARLRDPLLRTLDAINLAAALSLGDLPEAFVTYDDRLARAATRLKLTIVRPS
jgi:predicted nucleic acid-binding protein